MYTRGIVSQEYVRERLQIPEEAGQGTMFQPQAMPAKPLQDVPANTAPERWRLKQTKDGNVIAERIEE